MDSKQVYIFNEAKFNIEIFDLTFKPAQVIELCCDLRCLFDSIENSQDFDYLFNEKVALKVENNLLYACTNHKIDTYQLSNMSLINTSTIKLHYSPLSKHFIQHYCILRFYDHIRLIHLKHGTSFKKNVTNLDFGNPRLKLRTLDESKIVFFNRDKYFIST